MCNILNQIMFREFFCFWLCIKLTFSDLENVHKRHEYNLTFKGPIIVIPNSNEVPFFEIGGHLIPGKDRIRLTTSLPDQQGWIWSKGTGSFEGFQIDLVFRISGSGRIGADGLALWVVQNVSKGGSALGASNIWNGLGVFFDTYDNDGQKDNPVILAIINDGTKHYSSNTDGHELSAGHCLRDFRNRPHPVHARIFYYNKSLEVYISSGIEANNPELELCFKIDADLPRGNYHFGLTAATGTLADDHDIEKFEVHSLSDNKNIKEEEEKQRIDEQKRYEEEFQRKLNDITKVEQTDKTQPMAQSEESDMIKNLIVIWQEIIRQNKLLKEIAVNVEGLKKSQVLKSQSKEESDTVHQIDSMRKDFLGVKHSLDSMIQKMETSSNTYPQEQTLDQLRNTIDVLKSAMLKEFEKIKILQGNFDKAQDKFLVSMNSKVKEESCDSCISTSLILFTGFAQVICIIGFLVYQKHKENSAKKFY